MCLQKLRDRIGLIVLDLRESLFQPVSNERSSDEGGEYMTVGLTTNALPRGGGILIAFSKGPAVACHDGVLFMFRGNLPLC
jgi:hypothetical protein